MLAHITEKCVSVSWMREPKTVRLVVHLSKFAAIQVLNTDIVWPKVSLGPELLPMALVWLIGLEFGIYKSTLAISIYIQIVVSIIRNSFAFLFSQFCNIFIIKFITYIEMRPSVLGPFPGKLFHAPLNNEAINNNIHHKFLPIFRCILIKETNDLRHFKNLETALGEILLTEK